MGLPRKIKIHFPGFDQSLKTVPIAYTCGVGQLDEKFACGLSVEDAALKRTCDILRDEGEKLWECVGADDAEIMVYPHSVYEVNEGLISASKLAKQKGVEFISFRCHDDAKPVTLPHGVVYKTSAFASKMTEQEYVLPAFVCDYMQGIDESQAYRQKQDEPTVSFCGFTGSAMSRLLYLLEMRFEKARGLRLRAKCIDALEGTPGVKTNFIKRQKFWGGAKSRFKDDKALAQEVREEYIRNLAESDYVLCLRGTGNFSFRFYDTLSRGRIPLFVNTDSQLPFSDQIDWKKHCVWVEEEQLADIGKILLEFHRGLSAEEFVALQRENYQMWRQWLGPVGYYLKIFGLHLDMNQYSS